MKIEAPAPALLPQLLTLWKEAFGDWNGFWEMFLETAFLPEHCRCATEGGKVCAALYWFDAECRGQKMAYIYAVVTSPACRGQGLCRKLLEQTHRSLAASGYAASLLVPAGEGLREMYRKLGYRGCTGVREFSCHAGTEPAALRAVGPEEYARLRRGFLPAGGVIQEGENLNFLARQAQFYAGEDFLMAAYTEDAVLHAVELLGNPNAAPGIVTALNCTRGEFRTSGEEKPFAMWHPLREDAAAPEYFGFEFD